MNPVSAKIMETTSIKQLVPVYHDSLNARGDFSGTETAKKMLLL